MTTRLCNKCKEEKDIKSFSKYTHVPLIRKKICKICINKRVSYLYHNNIGKSGKKHVQERAIQNFEKNPIREKAKRAKGSMKNASIKYGIRFDSEYFTINKLELLLKESRYCPCCGVKFLYRWGTNRKPEPKSPSFDKFIPQLGYVKGNVFLICWRCNNLKRDATEEELFRIAEWMVKTRSALQIKEYK